MGLSCIFTIIIYIMEEEKQQFENETDVDKLRFQFAQSKAKEARRQSFFKYLKTLVVKIQSLVS
jgi:hypothetical protein